MSKTMIEQYAAQHGLDAKALKQCIATMLADGWKPSQKRGAKKTAAAPKRAKAHVSTWYKTPAGAFSPFAAMPKAYADGRADAAKPGRVFNPPKVNAKAYQRGWATQRAAQAKRTPWQVDLQPVAADPRPVFCDWTLQNDAAILRNNPARMPKDDGGKYVARYVVRFAQLLLA